MPKETHSVVVVVIGFNYKELGSTLGLCISIILCQHFAPSGPIIRINFFPHLAL